MTYVVARSSKFGVLVLGVLCVMSSLLMAESRVSQKKLREMSTDRPDQTESPYTVDAGHFQIEIDAVNAAWDHNREAGANEVTNDVILGNANFKIGVTDTIDLQIMGGLLSYSRVEDRMVPSTTHALGFGELTTRLKINLWGNDGGNDALAIMPYIKWPLPESTLRNGKMEGGIILPYSVSLNESQGLGLMAQIDWVNTGGNNMQTQWFTTATLEQSFTEQLGGYVELAARFIPQAQWQAQFDFGVTYRPYETIQLDLGTNIGLSPEAPDVVVFTGISYRY